MFGVTYSLRLLQPVIVSMLDPGDENAARSLAYVPGSVMRGALGMKYIASHNLAAPAQDPNCRALFFGDETSFLDCLPMNKEGGRCLPTPLSWFANKKNVADWADEEAAELPILDAALDKNALQTVDDAKSVAPHAQFIQIANNKASSVSTRRETATHIRRPHKLREIKSELERSIFTYEALSANQILAGVVLCKTKNGADTAKELLEKNSELMIGRSRSAGYGRVRIEAVSEPIPDWTEFGSMSGLPDPVTLEDDQGNIVSSLYIVTLTSYALSRDADGQFSPDLSIQPDPLNPVGCFRQMEMLGGYNRKWGLPTQQVYALRPGSVFVFQAHHVDKNALFTALHNGIGERKNDGFGRIAVNRQTDPHVFLNKGAIKTAALPKTGASGLVIAQDIEKIIADAALRRILNHRVAETAATTRIVRPPSNAMLSRVMLAARQAAISQDIHPIAKLLADARQDASLKEKTSRKPAQVAMENARIFNQPLGEWLRERVDKCDIESQLKLATLKDSDITLGSYKAQITPALKAEYTARLIERIVKLAIKNNKKEGAR